MNSMVNHARKATSISNVAPESTSPPSKMSSSYPHTVRHVMKKDKAARTPSDPQGPTPRIPSSAVGSRDGLTPAHGTRLPPKGHSSRHSVSDWSTVVPAYGDEETERNHVALWGHMARRSSSPVKPSGNGHAPSEKSRRSSKPKHSTMVVATTSTSPQKSEEEDDVQGRILHSRETSTDGWLRVRWER